MEESGSATRVTFLYERWRAVAHGVLETAGQTFLVLIAVRAFEAGAWSKALVASGTSLGLLLGPWIVSWVSSSSLTAASAAARLSMLGAAAFFAMAVFSYQWLFVLGSMIAMGTSTTVIPLLTQIYQDNYPSGDRGRLFSRTVIIRIATAALFSELAGRLLTDNIDAFQWLLGIFGVSLLLVAFCFTRYPSRRLVRSTGTHPFRALGVLREDGLFRHTLICWMLLGFANLMMQPLRVEYLANPVYDLAMETGTVALLVGVIPNLARLIMSPVWGWLFDHMNFFVLRMALNISFALGIGTFFLSNEMTGLVVGSVLFGISNAGGDVAWSLWVTKLALPEKVADYMSVHTFFTGLRGLAAPLLGFHLIQILPVATLGWISVSMMILATILLIPTIPFGRTH